MTSLTANMARGSQVSTHSVTRTELERKTKQEQETVKNPSEYSTQKNLFLTQNVKLEPKAKDHPYYKPSSISMPILTYQRVHFYKRLHDSFKIPNSSSCYYGGCMAHIIAGTTFKDVDSRFEIPSKNPTEQADKVMLEMIDCIHGRLMDFLKQFNSLKPTDEADFLEKAGTDNKSIKALIKLAGEDSRNKKKPKNLKELSELRQHLLDHYIQKQNFLKTKDKTTTYGSFISLGDTEFSFHYEKGDGRYSMGLTDGACMPIFDDGLFFMNGSSKCEEKESAEGLEALKCRELIITDPENVEDLPYRLALMLSRGYAIRNFDTVVREGFKNIKPSEFCNSYLLFLSNHYDKQDTYGRFSYFVNTLYLILQVQDSQLRKEYCNALGIAISLAHQEESWKPIVDLLKYKEEVPKEKNGSELPKEKDGSELPKEKDKPESARDLFNAIQGLLLAEWTHDKAIAYKMPFSDPRKPHWNFMLTSEKNGPSFFPIFPNNTPDKIAMESLSSMEALMKKGEACKNLFDAVPFTKYKLEEKCLYVLTGCFMDMFEQPKVFDICRSTKHPISFLDSLQNKDIGTDLLVKQKNKKEDWLLARELMPLLQLTQEPSSENLLKIAALLPQISKKTQGRKFHENAFNTKDMFASVCISIQKGTGSIDPHVLKATHELSIFLLKVGAISPDKYSEFTVNILRSFTRNIQSKDREVLLHTCTSLQSMVGGDDVLWDESMHKALSPLLHGLLTTALESRVSMKKACGGLCHALIKKNFNFDDAQLPLLDLLAQQIMSEDTMEGAHILHFLSQKNKDTNSHLEHNLKVLANIANTLYEAKPSEMKEKINILMKALHIDSLPQPFREKLLFFAKQNLETNSISSLHHYIQILSEFNAPLAVEFFIKFKDSFPAEKRAFYAVLLMDTLSNDSEDIKKLYTIWASSIQSQKSVTLTHLFLLSKLAASHPSIFHESYEKIVRIMIESILSHKAKLSQLKPEQIAKLRKSLSSFASTYSKNASLTHLLLTEQLYRTAEAAQCSLVDKTPLLCFMEGFSTVGGMEPKERSKKIVALMEETEKYFEENQDVFALGLTVLMNSFPNEYGSHIKKYTHLLFDSKSRSQKAIELISAHILPFTQKTVASGDEKARLLCLDLLGKMLKLGYHKEVEGSCTAFIKSSFLNPSDEYSKAFEEWCFILLEPNILPTFSEENRFYVIKNALCKTSSFTILLNIWESSKKLPGNSEERIQLYRNMLKYTVPRSVQLTRDIFQEARKYDSHIYFTLLEALRTSSDPKYMTLLQECMLKDDKADLSLFESRHVSKAVRYFFQYCANVCVIIPQSSGIDNGLFYYLVWIAAVPLLSREDRVDSRDKLISVVSRSTNKSVFFVILLNIFAKEYLTNDDVDFSNDAVIEMLSGLLDLNKRDPAQSATARIFKKLIETHKINATDLDNWIFILKKYIDHIDNKNIIHIIGMLSLNIAHLDKFKNNKQKIEIIHLALPFLKKDIPLKGGERHVEMCLGILKYKTLIPPEDLLEIEEKIRNYLKTHAESVLKDMSDPSFLKCSVEQNNFYVEVNIQRLLPLYTLYNPDMGKKLVSAAIKRLLTIDINSAVMFHSTITTDHNVLYQRKLDDKGVVVVVKDETQELMCIAADMISQISSEHPEKGDISMGIFSCMMEATDYELPSQFLLKAQEKIFLSFCNPLYTSNATLLFSWVHVLNKLCTKMSEDGCREGNIKNGNYALLIGALKGNIKIITDFILFDFASIQDSSFIDQTRAHQIVGFQGSQEYIERVISSVLKLQKLDDSLENRQNLMMSFTLWQEKVKKLNYKKPERSFNSTMNLMSQYILMMLIMYRKVVCLHMAATKENPESFNVAELFDSASHSCLVVLKETTLKMFPVQLAYQRGQWDHNMSSVCDGKAPEPYAKEKFMMSMLQEEKSNNSGEKNAILSAIANNLGRKKVRHVNLIGGATI